MLCVSLKEETLNCEPSNWLPDISISNRTGFWGRWGHIGFWKLRTELELMGCGQASAVSPSCCPDFPKLIQWKSALTSGRKEPVRETWALGGAADLSIPCALRWLYNLTKNFTTWYIISFQPQKPVSQGAGNISSIYWWNWDAETSKDMAQLTKGTEIRPQVSWTRPGVLVRLFKLLWIYFQLLLINKK